MSFIECSHSFNTYINMCRAWMHFRMHITLYASPWVSQREDWSGVGGCHHRWPACNCAGIVTQTRYWRDPWGQPVVVDASKHFFIPPLSSSVWHLCPWCVHTHTHTHASTHTHTHTPMHACTYTHRYTLATVRTFKHTQADAYAHTRTNTHTHTHTHTYPRTHTYTDPRTHTHRHTEPPAPTHRHADMLLLCIISNFNIDSA